MKHIICLLTILFFARFLPAQVKLPHYPDSVFSTYYHQRATHYRSLPKTKGDIIFIGNSITEGGEWNELFNNDQKIKNRGISGDITRGVLNRMDELAKRKPAKVFLMIGTNDLARNISTDNVVKNILWFVSYMKQETPSTQIYVQSILPVSDEFKMFKSHSGKGNRILQVNTDLKRHADKHGYNYINLHDSFLNSEGKLDARYTNDGLHLTGEGYLLWKHIVFPFVYNLQEKPSLIPLPKQIKWGNEIFRLYDCSKILVKEDSLLKEAVFLQSQLEKSAISLSISKAVPENESYIELRLRNLPAGQNKEEAYNVHVTAKKITITADSRHGIFNAIQTLLQLARNNSTINTCEITDWPAFSWRGFMVDVGRNFQSIKLLKQQIDVMAAYKLNVFHFHLTEDIAWRLQSKLYPQLTESRFMLRNPGEFYSIEDLKELIAYCKERFITLVPEIDMPGHSAAFTRALGVDMQSAEGTEICKNILKEFCKEFDVPYVHIGGDEVKITNKNFLPQMIGLLNSFDKKVVAWDPGGNVPPGTILQMWNGGSKAKKGFPAIDSRHLYLNHFDPIDGVVSTFNHQVCDVDSGDQNNLGATLCNWPDRRVSNESDLVNMNAVYPVMLAFAERCWQGGGWKNYLSDISTPGNQRYTAFVEFENRLLEHKTLYFKSLSFPYLRQSHLEWKMIGPFNNQGKTESVFAPETKKFTDTVQLKNYPILYGGTIWLRHFWHPMIGSHLQDPQDSTTWYATTKIWSDEEGLKDFWIGFDNLSRSTATDSPPAGEWDNRKTKIWVNGKIIEPPQWRNGGRKADAETPLVDEGYEYREPTKIFLHKGWNTVLIKAPAGSLKGRDWQNPVKWMFSFIPN